MKLLLIIVCSFFLIVNGNAGILGEEIFCKVKNKADAKAKITLVNKLFDDSRLSYIIVRLTNPYTVIKFNITKKPEIFRVVKKYYYMIFDIKTKTIYRKDITTKKTLQTIELINCSSTDDFY